MRIGTWNLENNVRIDDKRKFLLAQNCDVWLLSEVCEELLEDSGQRFAHFNAHWSSGDIRTGTKYAAVLSVQELEPVEEDIHFASAAAVINGIAARTSDRITNISFSDSPSDIQSMTRAFKAG